ncbi:MAG: hypothetical protein E2O56_03115, partial [Gammaproteobacteria bacterium]
MTTVFNKLAMMAVAAVFLGGCATTYQAYYPADDGYYYSDDEGAYYSGASVYYEDGYYGGSSNVFVGVGFSSGPGWWPYWGPFWYGPHSGFFFNFGYWGPWYSGFVGWGYPWWGWPHHHTHWGWPNYYWGYPGYNADVRREVARVVNNRSNRHAATSRGGVGQTPTPIDPKGAGTRTGSVRD